MVGCRAILQTGFDFNVFFCGVLQFQLVQSFILRAVRVVGNALQPQISVINVVSNLIESGLE